MRVYLDADIFLALFKEEDRFKRVAKKFITNSSHEYITSTMTCLEIWFYLYRNNLQNQIVDVLRAITSKCKIINHDISTIESAAILSQENKLSPADAIHATIALDYDAIVSTDKSFDKIKGLKRIDFSK